MKASANWLRPLTMNPLARPWGPLAVYPMPYMRRPTTQTPPSAAPARGNDRLEIISEPRKAVMFSM